MKRLLWDAFGWLVAAAGGRPAVVLPLYRGLEKAAAGRSDLLRSQSRRRVTISAEALRLIMIVVTALGSVLLGLFMLVRPEGFRFHLGVLILVGAHWLLVVNMVVAQAGPALLVDDDQQILGWWPISRRELLLARLATVLKPALQISLALAAVPLLVLAVTGPPPVLPALLLGAGLLVQTLGVTFGTAVALALVVRLWGRRKAQRLAALAADGNVFMYFWLLMVLVPRLEPLFGGRVHLLPLLPPLWFTAFGHPQAGPVAWAAAAVGTLTSLLLVVAGLRLLVQAATGETVEPREKRPARWHYSVIVSGLLRPMMPGPEGWAVRRLLESHLREDWRFIGGMLTLPAMMVMMFFVLNETTAADLAPDDLAWSALGAVENTHFVMIMAASVIFLTTFSSTPRALWIVALADLDTGRLLAAQRGMIRGLVTLPVLVLYAVKAAWLGAGPLVVAADVLLLGLQVEIIISIMQPFIMIMPFSLGYTNDQTARRVMLGFLAMGLAIVFLILNFLYTNYLNARVVAWGVLPMLLVLVRIWQKRRTAGRRLRMGDLQPD